MGLDYLFGLVADETNHWKSIDKVHSEVHKGHHFTLARSTTLVAASTYYIAVIAPDTTTEPHFQLSISAAAALTVGLYSAPTASTATATSTSYNNNQRSTLTATVEVEINLPSTDVTATGTLLEGHIFGANMPPARIGGDASNREEWILNRNTKYLIMINSVSTNTIFYNLSWYEQ